MLQAAVLQTAPGIRCLLQKAYKRNSAFSSAGFRRW